MADLPLAPQGVFLTVQGEGSLSGLPMVFVRLAGCPVGCRECDTDYSVHTRKPVREIVRDIAAAAVPGVKWVWVTGGEPTIHDLTELLEGIHGIGLRAAIATAGINEVQRSTGFLGDDAAAVSRFRRGWDFVSVSPHRIDGKLVQYRGDQVNLVFGLNDLTPAECEPVRERLESGFTDWWVTPCDGKPETLHQCVEWVNRHRGWRIGNQSHKGWKLP